MPPKRKQAARKATARRRTTATRKKTVSRARVPRGGPIHARIGASMALFAAGKLETHDSVIQSRKDAAILRVTHKNCTTCKGNGSIYTKNKQGVFTGSKPCTAKPTATKAGKWAVYKASRFGAEKRTGLVGWSCPCGRKEKARYRDAKTATAALRAHEKKKHGGTTVGGQWFAQVPPEAMPEPKQPAVSKVVTDSGMTDEQWIKQNKKLHPGKAIAQGKCWKCAGNGKLHGAFGGEQTLTVCDECRGSGKAAVAA
ncbi:hypothetical protein ACN2WE_05200 [Streptomyces sp. cg28]|uniref:hypothetical protein n=1 Tax=Streptomyces sp. cg28 TaxID=3403457 RepID=UPI003B218B34